VENCLRFLRRKGFRKLKGEGLGSRRRKSDLGEGSAELGKRGEGHRYGGGRESVVLGWFIKAAKEKKISNLPVVGGTFEGGGKTLYKGGRAWRPRRERGL